MKAQIVKFLKGVIATDVGVILRNAAMGQPWIPIFNEERALPYPDTADGYLEVISDSDKSKLLMTTVSVFQGNLLRESKLDISFQVPVVGDKHNLKFIYQISDLPMEELGISEVAEVKQWFLDIPNEELANIIALIGGTEIEVRLLNIIVERIRNHV